MNPSQSQMPDRAALFDFDGVIFDTETQYSKFWSQIGRKYRPEDKDFDLRIKGSTLDEILDEYFSDIPQAKEQITEGLAAVEENMVFTYVPGAEKFIHTLKQAGIKLAIVTSSGHTKMDRVVKLHPEIGKTFDRIIAAEDFKRSKPDPDCYLTAAKYFGLDRDRCIVLEDSRKGLMAGKNAGMRVVGLATTLPRKEVERWATVVINNFLDPAVTGILQDFFGIEQKPS